jgi:hypothetical protein
MTGVAAGMAPSVPGALRQRDGAAGAAGAAGAGVGAGSGSGAERTVGGSSLEPGLSNVGGGLGGGGAGGGTIT